MNDLDKMNLIAIVQQLPKDDIDFIETYISIMEEKITELKRENNLLKADIEASQEIISDYKKENKRLNNIINKLEKWLGESIEKHTEDYLDWKYDRNVYLAGSKKLQNVLDKLQELKGSDKE